MRVANIQTKQEKKMATETKGRQQSTKTSSLIMSLFLSKIATWTKSAGQSDKVGSSSRMGAIFDIGILLQLLFIFYQLSLYFHDIDKTLILNTSLEVGVELLL